MATVLDTLIVKIAPNVDVGQLRKLDGAVQRTQQRLNSIGNSMLKFGTALTAARAADLLIFAQYEEKIAKIEGLVGISRKQLNAWQGDIEDIADDTGTNLTDLADGLFFITSAGFRGSNAIDILRLSARAAASGLGDMQTIADLLTGAMKVYGEENLSGARATDVLVAAIREGKLEPTTLAGALSQVLPFAQEVGVEFHEVAGALAAMSKQNIGAERGATALRGVFNKIIRPTEMARKEMQSYGIDIDEIRQIIREKGLLAALRTLKTVFDGNSDAMGKVFEDSEALLGVLALTNDTAAENAEIIRLIDGSVGSADAAYDAMAKTLKFKFTTVMANLNIIMTEFGRLMAPTTKRTLDFATRVLRWFRKLDDGTKMLIVHILALGPILIGLGIALKVIAFALGGLATIVAVAPFAGLIAIFAAIAGAAYLAARGIRWLLDWLNQFTVGEGPHAMGVGEKIVWTISSGICNAAGVLKAALRWVFERLLSLLPASDAPEGPLSDLTARGTAIVMTLAAGVRAAAGVLKAALRWVFERLLSLLPASDAPEGPLSDLTARGTAIVMTLAAGVRAAAGVLKAALRWVFERLLSLLPASDAPEGPLSDLTARGTAIVMTLAAGVRAAAGVLVDAVKLVFQLALAALLVTAARPDWINRGKEIVANVVAGIQSAGSAVGAAIRALFEDRQAPAGPHAMGGGLAQRFGPIGTRIGAVMASTMVRALSVWPGILDLMNNAAKRIGFKNIGDLIGKIIGTALVVSAASLTGLLEWMTLQLGEVDFSAIGTRIGDYISDTLVTAVSSFQGLVEALLEAVGQIDYTRVGEAIGGFIRAALSGAWSLIGGLFDSSLIEQETNDAFFNAINAGMAGLGLLIIRIVRGAFNLVVGFINAAFAIDLLKAVEDAWDAVLEWLGTLDTKLYDAGAAMLQSMIDGILSVKDTLKESLKAAFRPIERLLPESDAEEGPFSRLFSAGQSIVNTIADGVKAAANVVSEGLPVGPPAAAGGGAGALAEDSAPRYNITLQFAEGSVRIVAPDGDVKTIADAFASAVEDRMRAGVEQADSRFLA